MKYVDKRVQSSTSIALRRRVIQVRYHKSVAKWIAVSRTRCLARARTSYIRLHINISRGGTNLVSNLRVIYLTVPVDVENRPRHRASAIVMSPTVITILVVRGHDASAIKSLRGSDSFSWRTR